jgi:hypothetical protein
LQFSTSHDLVNALLDHQGNAHVFIATKGSKEVYHVLISPEGGVQRELVETNRSPSTISAAFDSDAKLHLLLDNTELVQKESSWNAAPETPWEIAGIKVDKPRLVQVNTGLVRAFLVNGKEVGAGGRWDWYGFGGYGGGIIWPWHSGSKKLVMVPEAAIAEPFWYVLDPQDNLDTSSSMITADSKGNLDVVYTASRFMVVRESYQPRYAQISPMPPRPSAEHGVPATSDDNKRLYPVSGIAIPLFVSDAVSFDQASAAEDPESGTLLIVLAHDSSIVQTHGQWSLPLRLPLKSFFEPRLAPAGNDSFHLMAIGKNDVLYLLYAQGSWSAPVILGHNEVASTFGNSWDALGIASKGSNRAFAVWPTKTGIVGRWVEGPERIPAPPGYTSVQPREEPTPIPRDLVDFADGKTELITPGIVTGLSEAAAAGTNGKLTKTLHDTGQWKLLATVVQKDNYGDNLRWYYLGRAAEGMALCDAADHYYQVSKERSESFWTRCLSIACNGIKLPQILDTRFNAVEAMRSAGKCLTPQGFK